MGGNGGVAFCVRTGVDLVHVPRVARWLADPAFQERVFQPTELANGRLEHLAGVLAAKEALFKALGRKLPWHSVVVREEPGGRPQVCWVGGPRALQADVSFSHLGEYAVAVVVVLVAAVVGEG